MTRRSFGGLLLAAGAARAGAPTTLPFPNNVYSGWPTLARRRNGDLLLVWSGDREAHVCPFDRVLLSVSRDNGSSWTWPHAQECSALAGLALAGGAHSKGGSHKTPRSSVDFLA